MDVFTHAAMGAAAGHAFNRPILGAVVAVLPDTPLFLRRRPVAPPKAYDALHSLLATLAAGLIGVLFGTEVGIVCFIAWISHVSIDCMTHGPEWAPRLLWPLPQRFGLDSEWEWGNMVWWGGLGVATLWCGAWLSVP